MSDLRSEPSKPYTFPECRVALLDAHHADDGRRLYDRVTVEVLAELYEAAAIVGVDILAAESTGGALTYLARETDIDGSVIDEARELADVERRFGEVENDG